MARSPTGPSEQIPDAPLQDIVSRESDRVPHPSPFQCFTEAGQGERRVGTDDHRLALRAVAVNDGKQDHAANAVTSATMTQTLTVSNASSDTWSINAVDIGGGDEQCPRYRGRRRDQRRPARRGAARRPGRRVSREISRRSSPHQGSGNSLSATSTTTPATRRERPLTAIATPNVLDADLFRSGRLICERLHALSVIWSRTATTAQEWEMLGAFSRPRPASHRRRRRIYKYSDRTTSDARRWSTAQGS